MTGDSSVVRTAGHIKLCPFCSEPYDNWSTLKRHANQKHDQSITRPQ